MKRLSAAAEGRNAYDLAILKNSVLAFDRIYVPRIGTSYPAYMDMVPPECGVTEGDVAFLSNRGILVESPTDGAAALKQAREANRHLFKGEITHQEARDGRAILYSMAERIIAVETELSTGDTVVPVSSLATSGDRSSMDEQRETQIYSLVIDRFPTVDPLVPFDEVVGFKDQYGNDYRRFIQWVGDLAEKTNSPEELEGQLSEQLEVFDSWQRISDLDFKPGKLEIAFYVVGAVFDLLRRKPDKVGNRMAAFRKEKAKFLKAELNNPGRPVAFMARSIERFQT